MRLRRSMAVTGFVVMLAVIVPCFAQRPSGPATLENLVNSPEAQSTPTANEAPTAGPKRPAGTVARPKDGVQHPDLDKAWAKYEAVVAQAAEGIKAAISKQFDAATTKGDLDAAEKWQVIGVKFEKSGELPSDPEVKAAVSAVVADFKQAKEELSKAYELAMKALTMEKKIAEAKAVRDEDAALMASAPNTADTEAVGARDAKQDKLVIRSARFGADTRWQDITRLVAASVVSNSVIVSPSIAEFGDPAKRVQKRLEVKYRYGDGPEQVASALEDEDAIVIFRNSKVSAKGFRLLGGVYGAGTKWIDITPALRRFANGEKLIVVDYQDGRQLIGKDPVPYVHKHIVIKYIHDGEERCAAFRDGSPIRLP